MKKIVLGKDRYHQIGSMYTWCVENIGQGGYVNDSEFVWTVDTVFGTTTFTFKDSSDCSLFALRWL